MGSDSPCWFGEADGCGFFMDWVGLNGSANRNRKTDVVDVMYHELLICVFHIATEGKQT